MPLVSYKSLLALCACVCVYVSIAVEQMDPNTNQTSSASSSQRVADTPSPSLSSRPVVLSPPTASAGSQTPGEEGSVKVSTRALEDARDLLHSGLR